MGLLLSLLGGLLAGATDGAVLGDYTEMRLALGVTEVGMKRGIHTLLANRAVCGEWAANLLCGAADLAVSVDCNKDT